MFLLIPLFRQVFILKTLRNCNARRYKSLNYSGSSLKKSIFLGGQEALCSVGEQVLAEYLHADGDKDDPSGDLDPVLEKVAYPAA